MPFSEIQWRNGKPEVRENEIWKELVSVSGVPVDTLLERAMENWGPGYQHHFSMQFPKLLESAGGQAGWRVNYEVRSGGKVESASAWNTTGKRKKLLHNLGARESADYDPLDAIHGKYPSLVMFPCLDNKANAGQWLSGPEARRDIGMLRQLIAENYSYALGPDRDRIHLAMLYHAVGEGLSRRDFALQIQFALAKYADIHCRVAFSGSKVKLPRKNLPVTLRRVGEQTLCLRLGEDRLLEPEFPVLGSIEGIPVAKLWETAEMLGGNAGSWMRRIGLMLQVHGVELGPKLKVRLRSLDGKEKEISLDLNRRPPDVGMAPRVEGHVLSGQIGHLRLRRGLFADAAYRKEIVKEMYGLKASRGLILDLRGNPGGKRAYIPFLMHYFLPPAAHPAILNIATYRMDQGLRPPERVELLRGRGLYSASWENWDPAQRKVIDAWQLSQAEISGVMGNSRLSGRHFLLTSSARPPGVYPYVRPIVILIDRETASATELILANLQGRPQVTVMGERSTGGSGYPVLFELPYSKIQLYLPAMRSYTADLNLITQTEPDLRIAPDIEEVVEMLREGSDLVLEAARQNLLKQDSLAK